MDRQDYNREITRLTDERNKAICKDFEDRQGTAAPTALFSTLAWEYKMTAGQIRNIIISCGLYTVKHDR